MFFSDLTTEVFVRTLSELKKRDEKYKMESLSLIQPVYFSCSVRMEYYFLIVNILATAGLAQKPFPSGHVTSNRMNQPGVPSPEPYNLSDASIAIAQAYLDLFNITFSDDADRFAAMVNLVAVDGLVKSCNEKYDQKKCNYRTAVYPFNILSPEQIEIRKTGIIPSDSELNLLRKRRSITLSDSNDVCANLPESKNYTADGVVSPPQDQGDCSNCYIFSSVSALESAVALTYDTSPVKLSEQQLTDCVRNPNQPSPLGGCNRGRAEWVWNSTKLYDGAVKTGDYAPYTATDDGGCNETLPKVPHTKVDHWVFNPSGDEEALKCSLVKYGPHHISMDFSGNISSYSSGIYDDPTSNCNSTFVNGKMVKPYTHALTLVGYGSELNNAGVMTDYWLVKNSYGPNWGMNGYIKIARNKNNLCHVATDAGVPMLSSSNTSN